MAAGIIDPVRSFFQADARGAAAVYVFGSVGRSADTPASDVDVAVLFDRDPPATLDNPARILEGDLERTLGRRVDLVALNSASADLVHRVLADGVVVLDRDRPRRLRFEVQKRNEYFDLEPIRREYRRGTSGRPPVR